jgi:hypothetical protein
MPLPDLFFPLTRQKYFCPLGKADTSRCVVVTVESLRITEANSESVATWILYEVAVLAIFHWSVTPEGWFIAPLAGD